MRVCTLINKYKYQQNSELKNKYFLTNSWHSIFSLWISGWKWHWLDGGNNESQFLLDLEKNIHSVSLFFSHRYHNHSVKALNVLITFGCKFPVQCWVRTPSPLVATDIPSREARKIATSSWTWFTWWKRKRLEEPGYNNVPVISAVGSLPGSVLTSDWSLPRTEGRPIFSRRCQNLSPPPPPPPPPPSSSL